MYPSVIFPADVSVTMIQLVTTNVVKKAQAILLIRPLLINKSIKLKSSS
tara:strand:+ start:794 stop:940 length:147 start_codon:yes stop_codon:yes gene_type:complete